MLQVISSFAVIFFSLGLDQAYLREYHEYPDKASLLKDVITPGLLLLTIISVFLVAYDSTLISQLLFSIHSISLSVLVLACLIVAYISRFLSLILRIQEKGLAFSMSQVLPKALFLLIITFCAVLFSDLNFEQLITAHALSILSVMLIYSWNTKGEWTPAVKKKINKERVRKMLSFGVPLIFGGIAYWALLTMDRLFLRSLSTFEELGIYSIAVSLAAAAGIFSGIFTTIWAPTVYKWAANGENLDKIDEISEHVLACVFFIFVLSGMFSWLLAYFLPKAYVNVQYLLTLCMSVPLFYALSETTAVGIGVARKSSYSMLASFIAAGVNFGGNFLLTSDFGAAGAAISTAFAFWVFLISRTEMSCLVWKKVPRAKLYCISTICLLASTFTVLFGNQYQIYICFGWAALGVIGAIFFRHSICLAKNSAIQLFNKINSK